MHRFYLSYLAATFLLIGCTSVVTETLAQPNPWRGNAGPGLSSNRGGSAWGAAGWSGKKSGRHDLGKPFIFIDASPLMPYPHWDGMIDHRYNQHDLHHRPDLDYGGWHPGVAPDLMWSTSPGLMGSQPTSSGNTQPQGARRYGNHYPIDRNRALSPVTTGAITGAVAPGTVQYKPTVQPAFNAASLPFPIIATKAVAFSAQQRAEFYFREGNYSEAAKLARQVTVLDSDNGPARLFAAQTFFAIGDYERATAEIKTAIEMLPVQNWDYVVREFRAFYGQNDYVEQMERLNQFLLEFPNHRSARLLRGYHYAGLGHWQAADDDLSYAIAVGADEHLGNELVRWTRGQKRSSNTPLVEPPQPVWGALGHAHHHQGNVEGLLIESYSAPPSSEELPSPLQREQSELLLPPRVEVPIDGDD